MAPCTLCQAIRSDLFHCIAFRYGHFYRFSTGLGASEKRDSLRASSCLDVRAIQGCLMFNRFLSLRLAFSSTVSLPSWASMLLSTGLQALRARNGSFLNHSRFQQLFFCAETRRASRILCASSLYNKERKQYQ